MIDQISRLTVEIDRFEDEIRKLAKEAEVGRCLQTMPGIGPILAIEAFAPPMQCFRSGRAFAAWLGLVPLQNSSGGNIVLARRRRRVSTTSGAC